MTCRFCGNGLSLLSTHCPRCGKKYIGRATLIILAIIIGFPSVLIGIGWLITSFLSKMERGGY